MDVKAYKAETAEEVAARVRRILAHVPPERLWLNPDCGFWETPRWVTRLKLAALTAGARLVRQEARPGKRAPLRKVSSCPSG